MINQDFDIARLIAAYLSGELTPPEQVALDAWREEDDAHEALFQQICSGDHLRLHLAKRQSFDAATGWKEVTKRIQKKNHRVLYLNLLRYAAIILLPVLVVAFALTYTPSLEPNSKERLLATPQQIVPGEAKAILTLNNGQVFYLDKRVASEGQAPLSNAQIQVDSTLLDYRLAKSDVAQKSPVYNKVEIPCGGEYTLVLNDGTKVHLNSQSSLRFPVIFADECREVELVGEAYFEVTKSGKPFMVHTKGMKIEVLGTSFNISAYPGEACQATLVSGSVKVASEEGESLILKPSQQAVLLPEGGNMQVRTVDALFYTSWVKGKIYFKDQRLEDIMKTLSRWYDIHVQYADESIKNIRFGCHVDRYDEITPFVELLEATKNVKIDIHNKTIIFNNH